MSSVPEGSRSRRLVGLRRVGLWFVVAALLAMAVGPAAAQSVPGAVPDRPGRPTLDSVTSDSATISWADAGDSSVTGYQVLRRDRAVDAKGVFHVIAEDVSGTSYTDESVEASSRYNYRVKARNANGLSRRSLVVRVEVPAALEAAETETGPVPEDELAVPEWSAVVSVGSYDGSTASMLGYSTWSRTGSVSDRDFVLDGSTYRVLALVQLNDGLYLAISPEVPADFTLSVGGEELTASASSVPVMAGMGRYWWNAPDALFGVGDAVDVSLTTVADSEAAVRPAAPPAAHFSHVPALHDGTDAVSLRLRFAEQVAVTATTLRDDVIAVTGATITGVEQSTAGSTASWNVTLQPDSNADIIVELVAAACGQTGAVCTADGRKLHNSPRATVRGPGSALLAELSVAELEFSSAFDPAVVLYFADTPVDVTSVTVTAVAAREGIDVVIAPADADSVTAGHQVALTPDSDTVITVTTTSADDTTTLQYWVSVTVPFDPTDTTTQLDAQDSQLASLSLQGLALASFDSSQARYEIDAPAGVSETVVVAEPVDADAAVELLVVRSDDPTFTIERTAAQGSLTASGVTLATVGDTLALLRITSADGLQQTVYVVLIHATATPNSPQDVRGPSWQPRGVASLLQPLAREVTPVSDDATLSGLSLTGVSLVPEFSPTATDYEVMVSADIEQVTVDFTTSDSNANIAIMPADADPDTEGWQISLFEPDVGGEPSKTVVTIIVGVGNIANIYIIDIYRPAASAQSAASLSWDYTQGRLTNLKVLDSNTEHQMFPRFRSYQFDYDVRGRSASGSYSATIQGFFEPGHSIKVYPECCESQASTSTDITDADDVVVGQSAEIDLVDGVNTFTVEVTSPQMTRLSYTLRITVGPEFNYPSLLTLFVRDENDTDLTLSPAFAANEYTYVIEEPLHPYSRIQIYPFVRGWIVQIDVTTVEDSNFDKDAATLDREDRYFGKAYWGLWKDYIVKDPARTKIKITLTAGDGKTKKVYTIQTQAAAEEVANPYLPDFEEELDADADGVMVVPSGCTAHTITDEPDGEQTTRRWSRNCNSHLDYYSHVLGSTTFTQTTGYAHFYKLVVDEEGEVSIDISHNTSSFLILREEDGTVIDSRHFEVDGRGFLPNDDSPIVEELEEGTYFIEAVQMYSWNNKRAYVTLDVDSDVLG